MAKQNSAQKRHKQSIRKRIRNRHVRATVKTVTKEVRAALEEGDAAKAAELIPGAASLIARAGSKGVYHRKNVSRKISRLSKAVRKASAASPKA